MTKKNVIAPRWKIVWQSEPDFKGNITYRATNGARVVNLLCSPGSIPGDEQFDADWSFVTKVKLPAKIGK